VPVYEYECNTCNKFLEVNRSFNDKEIFPLCKACGKNMTRVYGIVGVQFKGTGFYKTDNPK
jgi:putative FmdB family regulatory protein